MQRGGWGVNIIEEVSGWGLIQADERLLTLDWPVLPLPDDPLHQIGLQVCPVQLQWRESLNAGNTGTLRCFIPLAAGHGVHAFAQWCMGQVIHLHYPDRESARHHVALVIGADCQGESQGLMWFELRLQDAFSALSVGRRYRVFNECDLLSLTESVHAGWCGDQAWFSQVLALDLSGVSASARPASRAFVMQHGESDFDFLRRQWAQAGWHWHVAAQRGEQGWRQVLRVHDSARQWPAAADLHYRRTGLPEGDEAVDAFFVGRHWAPGRVGLGSSDYKQPPFGLSDSARVSGTPWTADVACRQQWLDQGHGQQSPVFWRALDVLHAQAMAGQLRGQGEGNTRRLAVGQCVQFCEAPPGLGADVWAVVQVSCEVNNPFSRQIVGQQAAGVPYRNQFWVVPVADPLTGPIDVDAPAAPFVGALTARVIGLDGEADAQCRGQIRTDEWGRVRVRFAFSLSSPGAADSAWLRVVQASAGTGGGHLFVPRVGDEVLVQFLSGHPDRPVVTGCLYNAEHLPAQFSVAPTALSNGSAHLAGVQHAGVRALATPRADEPVGFPRRGCELVFDHSPDTLAVALASDAGAARLSLGVLRGPNCLSGGLSGLSQARLSHLTDIQPTGDSGAAIEGFSLITGGVGVLNSKATLWLGTGGVGDPPVIPPTLSASVTQPRIGDVFVQSAANLRLHAMQHCAVVCGGQIETHAHGGWRCHTDGSASVSAHAGIVQRARNGGVSLLAEAGDVSLTAASGACQVAAAGSLNITSSNGVISLRAARAVELLAGGARLRLANGSIQLHAPGGIELRRAGQVVGGPVSHPAHLPDLQAGSVEATQLRRLLRCLSLEGDAMPGHRIAEGPLSADGLQGKALVGTGIWTCRWNPADTAGQSVAHEEDMIPGECPVED